MVANKGADTSIAAAAVLTKVVVVTIPPPLALLPPNSLVFITLIILVHMLPGSHIGLSLPAHIPPGPLSTSLPSLQASLVTPLISLHPQQALLNLPSRPLLLRSPWTRFPMKFRNFLMI